MKLILSTIVGLGVFCAAAIATHGILGSNTGKAPSHSSLILKKNLLKDGDVDGAMDQSRVLMSKLQQNNWDFASLGRDLLRLPDQDFAQNPELRSMHDTSFCFPDDPLFRNVAFYSTLYTTRGSGHENTHGFYIVGYRDGRVEQVPVSNIRLLPRHGSHGVWDEVWPGIKGYSDSLTLMGDDATTNPNYSDDDKP